MRSPTDYPYQDLTRRIIGAFLDLHATLGFGYPEPVYRRGLRVELDYRGLRTVSETRFEVMHRGRPIGLYRADLIVENTIIVEVKAGTSLDPTARPQLLNYMKCAKLPLGLVLHFGPKPVVRRAIMSAYLNRDPPSMLPQ
jgi:GxxExxY protein